MAFPQPAPGQVIRYAYLWKDEHSRGQREGLKDRPCAVLLVVTLKDGADDVVVLPISHAPPRNERDAIELPSATKRRLGLDNERSWVVLTEANRFLWPGPDLRPRHVGDPSSVVLGLLPRSFFIELRNRFLELAKDQKPPLVLRTD